MPSTMTTTTTPSGLKSGHPSALLGSPEDHPPKLVDFHCKRHGNQQVEIFWLVSHWTSPCCFKCVDERNEKERREEAELQRRQAERQRQSRIAAIWKDATIPRRYQTKRFADFAPFPENAGKALAICQGYAADFPNHLKDGSSLIFCGKPGTGKTHLACAIAGQIITQHQATVKFTSAAKILRQIKQTYHRASQTSEQQEIDRYRDISLLIIDEVGVQFGTKAEEHILFEIINERYQELRPTMLISNLGLDALAAYVGLRSIDRLIEGGGMVLMFNWPSKRKVMP